MNTFAVIGSRLPAGYEPLLAKLLTALHARGMIMRTHKGELGDLAMELFPGGKFSFWPSLDQTGTIYHVDPRSADLSKSLIRTVPGFTKAPADTKALAMAVGAAVMGLDGKSESRLVVTLEDGDLSKKVPWFVASKLGFKVHNVIDRNQLSELLCKLKS